MATDEDVRAYKILADAIAEIARIACDVRYPDGVKLFAIRERISQVHDAIKTRIRETV